MYLNGVMVGGARPSEELIALVQQAVIISSE